MSTRRMATPSRARNKASAASGSSPMAKRTAARERRPKFSFKRAATTTALWGLGVLNVILIVSFISKHFLDGSEPSISSETTVEAAPAEKIKIEVLNGCGVDGLARKYADLLKQHGFDPANVSTFERTNLPRTYIFDRQSNAMTNGLKMAKVLGLSEDYVSYQASPDRMVAVTLIIGNDYSTIPANPK